jgi:hypothetical protein
MGGGRGAGPVCPRHTRVGPALPLRGLSTKPHSLLARLGQQALAQQARLGQHSLLARLGGIWRNKLVTASSKEVLQGHRKQFTCFS